MPKFWSATIGETVKGKEDELQKVFFRNGVELLKALAFMAALGIKFTKTMLQEMFPELDPKRYGGMYGSSDRDVVALRAAIENIMNNSIPAYDTTSVPSAAGGAGAPAGEVTDAQAHDYFTYVLAAIWEKGQVVDEDCGQVIFIPPRSAARC